MKFLKTIRFDPSDTHVFEHAAEPDEWAIPGGFYFTGIEEETIKGKVKQVFSNGFLSIESFGFSTFTNVAEIDDESLAKLKAQFARSLMDNFNAPSMQEAEQAAHEELDYVIEMCAQAPINSIFALRRELDDENNIVETFSLVDAPTGKTHTKVWEIVE